MRRARAIGTMTLAALLPILTASTMRAEPRKGDVRQTSKSAEHGSERGRANTNAQWSADPERGWVRADERHLVDEPGASPKKRRHDNTGVRENRRSFSR
jgi:hypothetical protein